MVKQHVAALAIATLVGILVAAAPEAAKPTENPKCSVTFADEPGDAVRSDNRGGYIHGLDAVECQIWAGGSEDMTLRLGKTTTRRFAVDYRNLAQAFVSNPPTGVSTDGWFLNVRGIGTMALHETRTVQASIQAAGDSLMFRWCGGQTSNCTLGGIDPGSMLVAVTRTSLTQWTVTTDLPDGGDVAMLLRPSKNTYNLTALYHVPFAVEITCSACLAASR